MDKVFVPALNLSLPKLGFGTMRLHADSAGNIEKKPALELLHTALEAGINYFDTAYIYHNGKAEAFLGRNFFAALPRESFMAATKLPVFSINTVREGEEIFAKQLANLQLEYIDFYLAHSLDKKSWLKLRDMGGGEFLARLRKEGRARFVGLSYHGEPEELAEVLDAFPWDFVLLQINYFDWAEEAQNAKLQYETAAARGLPVFVMEPLRGGALAEPPQIAMDLFASSLPAPNPLALALRWAGSLEQVGMVLSGMNSLEQLQENLEIFSNFQPLGEQERQIMAQAASLLAAQPHVNCTGCDYCREACPAAVNISKAFECYNDFLRLGHPQFLADYLLFTPREQQAANCTSCASCIAHCPQKLNIPSELARMLESINEITV